MKHASDADVRTAIARSLESQFHAHCPWSALSADSGLVIERGDGVYVHDITGRRYLDAISGGWNAALGFSCKPLIDAATRQLQRLPYYHTLYNRVTPVSIELAEKMKAIAPFPAGKVAWCNSGSEAVETAVKLSWFYHAARGQPQRRKILTRWGSIHGSTIFTACMGGLGMHELLPCDASLIIRLGTPNPAAGGDGQEREDDLVSRLVRELEETIEREGADTIAAMVIEPIPVVEGFHVPPRAYLSRVQEVLQRAGILLIFDEVITGFGRTGEMFAATLLSCRPDMMVLGKGLTSGYAALAATIVSDAVSARLDEFSASVGEFPHAMTTAMHPVAMAVALQNIEELTSGGVLDHAQRMIPHFRRRLEALAALPIVARIDGVGLGGSVHLRADARPAQGNDLSFEIAGTCRSRGVFIHGQHGSLIVAPPLIITESQIDELFDCVRAVLTEIQP